MKELYLGCFVIGGPNQYLQEVYRLIKAKSIDEAQGKLEKETDEVLERVYGRHKGRLYNVQSVWINKTL